jgi:hypothetical protein
MEEVECNKKATLRVQAWACRGLSIPCAIHGLTLCPPPSCVAFAQTGALEADRDRALQQLQRAQAELGAAQRAQSAALAVQRQQAKGRERAAALERDLAAMVDKQVGVVVVVDVVVVVVVAVVGDWHCCWQ